MWNVCANNSRRTTYLDMCSATLAVRPTCKSHEYRSQQFRYDFSHMLSPKSVTRNTKSNCFMLNRMTGGLQISAFAAAVDLYFCFAIRFVSSVLLLIHIAHENEDNCSGIGVMCGSLRTKEPNHMLPKLGEQMN